MSKLKERCAQGGPAIGLWLSSTDANLVEAVATAGYDCVVLDLQHGGLGWESAGPLLQLLGALGVETLVRVPWPESAQIQRALDLGAGGVVVPMVGDPPTARGVARAARYPPVGERSYGPVRSWRSDNAAEPLCLAMIETTGGLTACGEIAAVPGIDGLFLGPVDLGLALNRGIVLGRDAAVEAAAREVATACRRVGRIAAAAAFGVEHALDLFALGFTLVVVGSDLGLARRAARAQVEALRAQTGEAGRSKP